MLINCSLNDLFINVHKLLYDGFFFYAQTPTHSYSRAHNNNLYKRFVFVCEIITISIVIFMGQFRQCSATAAPSSFNTGQIAQTQTQLCDVIHVVLYRNRYQLQSGREEEEKVRLNCGPMGPLWSLRSSIRNIDYDALVSGVRLSFTGLSFQRKKSLLIYEQEFPCSLYIIQLARTFPPKTVL